MAEPADPIVVEQVSYELGRYVYLLVDPRDSRPFYVGKGQGVRFLSHGRAVPAELDDGEGPKAQVIRDLRSAGLEPEIWIARYGLGKEEYTSVEGALIDLLLSFPVMPAGSRARHRPLTSGSLTNARREAACGHGMVLLDQLVDDFAAPVLVTTEPLLLITLGAWLPSEGEEIAGGRVRYGAGFKREWYDSDVRRSHLAELAAGTSAWWKVSPRQVERRGIEHVVAVYRGVTRGLFHVESGSWETFDGRAACWFDELVTSGALFDEVVGRHGHRVPGRAKGSQNPLLYWPRPPAAPSP